MGGGGRVMVMCVFASLLHVYHHLGNALLFSQVASLTLVTEWLVGVAMMCSLFAIVLRTAVH